MNVKAIVLSVSTLISITCLSDPIFVRDFSVSYADEHYVVPEGEVWKLSWNSPYEAGDVGPAYEVRVVSGPAFVGGAYGSTLRAYSNKPTEAGLLDVNAGPEGAEIWLHGGAEFYCANDSVSVNVEAYVTDH